MYEVRLQDCAPWVWQTRGVVCSSVLPAPESELGQRFRDRLASDLIAWLTVVADSGTPQPAPVWFLWDENAEHALIYSQATARRLAWISSREQVSLHLVDNGRGHDYLVLTGTLRYLEPSAYPAASENPTFVGKYRALMEEVFGTPEAYDDAFSVPLEFKPSRSRGH